jgi:Coiled-coil domain-containing protein 124 /Oxs1
MASLKSAKTGNSKSAQKKTVGPPSRGLDLAQLDIDSALTTAALNASGIDNALDALAITTDSKDTVDRHPERRFKGAYMAFEIRRLEEMADDKTLRRQQKIDLIRKEFEKSPENPFNQVSASYNTSKEEIQQIRQQEKDKAETRLVSSP